MNRAYRLYCRIATIVFVLNTVYPLTTKLLQERLAEDWLHSVLHLCSALFGIYAGWYAPNVTPAKVFTWSIGLLYLALGVYGWFTPGFLLDTPLAIPLRVADNVFHLILSVPALAIIVLHMRGSLQGEGVKKEDTPVTQERFGLGKMRSSWPFGAMSLIVIAIALLAAPARLEGPVLVPISPGHALAVLDSIALGPLLVGAGWLYWGLWKRRNRLYEALRRSPVHGSLAVFVAGAGIGLLLASVLSQFFWWWAVGAALFSAMTIAALVAATRG